ncbi:hypothetical protein CCP3SC15_580022 [Gammaproteobacteria bacterium]
MGEIEGLRVEELPNAFDEERLVRALGYALFERGVEVEIELGSNVLGQRRGQFDGTHYVGLTHSGLSSFRSR